MKRYIFEVEYKKRSVDLALIETNEFQYDHDKELKVHTERVLWNAYHSKYRGWDDKEVPDWIWRVSWAHHDIANIKEVESWLFQLKSENELQADLFKLLINIKEKVEIRIKIQYIKGERI